MDAGAGAVAGSPSSRGGPGRERRERGVPSEPWMQPPVPWPGRRAREVARGGNGVSEACRASEVARGGSGVRRRIFRRIAAVSAVVAGAAGITANALLIGYYVLARPW